AGAVPLLLPRGPVPQPKSGSLGGWETRKLGTRTLGNSSEATSLGNSQGERGEPSSLDRLYEKFIEPKLIDFGSPSGRRNEFMVESVKFLYHVVAPQVLRRLMREFYQHNKPCFKSTIEQHMNETNSMLESVSRNYPSKLSEVEREIYGNL